MWGPGQVFQDTVRAAMPMEDAYCRASRALDYWVQTPVLPSLHGHRSSAKGGNDGNNCAGALGELFMHLLREMKKGLLFLATTIILAITFLPIIFTLRKVK